MSEYKDTAIKLFGKTIQLLHLEKANEQPDRENIKETLEKEHDITQSTSYGINDDPKTPTTEKETSSKNTTKKENPNENSNSDEKKPDKILPCPRCNSMDTKFCYFNNYNVNQPRHFCRNCQRYWTAGGTMRNTPVGSGRRKNKSLSSASYYRHLIISERSLKSNGNVLNFGSDDVPLCESMNQAFNFTDKSQIPEDDHSSSATNSVKKGRNLTNLTNFQNYPVQIPCFAPPWPCQWNSRPYRPVSFYPSPTPQYLGCTVQVPPPQWSMPWITPPSDQTTLSSPLGKHSRSEEFSRDQDFENGVLTPKNMRINDPNEASKNSLLSTLGIAKDETGNNSIKGGNVRNAFQSKCDEKNEVVVSSSANSLANPVALSRSLNFRETL